MRMCKVPILLLSTVAATLVSGPAASAEVDVYGEGGDTGRCGPVNVMFDYVVEGGCHFELDSEHHFALVAQTAGGPVTLSNCNMHLESRIGGDGVGAVTQARLTSEPPPGTVPVCTRAPCDTASAIEIPWPMSITESAGLEVVETTFCLRALSSGPGSAGTTCELHPQFSDIGHIYEIGDGLTYGCENLPIVSIQGLHLINEAQPGQFDENVEIEH